MAIEHKERGSISLVIAEMQIKTTMKFYYIPTRMVKILEKIQISSIGKDLEQPECSHSARATVNVNKQLGQL